jgi:peptidyl-prolyl cis-trans isomerase A (cyclophilin A)
MRKALCISVFQLLPLPVMAQVYADFRTSRGDFTCELNIENTPRTAANFITLAEGTRAWFDGFTGLVSDPEFGLPYYDGLSINRIIDAKNLRLFHAGSRTGEGDEGPGYNLPDEFDEQIPDTYRFDRPYLLAMANAGPSTNGAQFFITGSAAPSLTGSYTIFGHVIAGQRVVDEILKVEVDEYLAPLQPVIIEQITIRREGEEAWDFNEFAIALPEVKATEGGLNRRSPNAPPSDGEELDPNAAEEPQHSYTTTYPDDLLTPDTITGNQLYLQNESGEYLFCFNQIGPQTYLIVLPSGDTRTGIIKQASYTPNGYSADLVVETESDGLYRYQLAPSAVSTSDILTGTQTGSFHNALFGWVAYGDRSEFSLTPIR